ncbi:MAG: DUF6763 family protein [Pseudomonadota bacterium]|nr:DUF6763 family protein [Pseudomonadota bacterium]
MYSPIPPKFHQWYRLADAEVFRVTDIDHDNIQIQYPDGTFETVEMAIWHKLGAMELEPDEEWLEELDEPIKELDFLTLGVASGSEGLEYMDFFTDNER